MTRQEIYLRIMDAFIEGVESRTKRTGEWMTPWARSQAFQAAQRALGPVVTIGAAAATGGPCSRRYPLWQHMHDTHGLILTEDELHQIERAVKRIGAAEPRARKRRPK